MNDVDEIYSWKGFDNSRESRYNARHGNVASKQETDEFHRRKKPY